MKKLILLLILVCLTSFIPYEKEKFDYNAERREIQENIDQANRNLDEIAIIINSQNKLSRTKKI